jgi:hypothetical protein
MSSNLFGGEVQMGPVFTATYDSEDSCCGGGIEEGNSIRADGHGGWVHADCKDAEQAPPVKIEPCPKCFLVHAWACEA